MRASLVSEQGVQRAERNGEYRLVSCTKVFLPFILLTMLMLCAFQETHADTQGIFGDYWAIPLRLNLAEWDELHKVSPSNVDFQPDRSGPGVSFGGYVSTIRWNRVRVFAGMELGFVEFGSSDDYFEPIDEPGLAYDVDFLTASMKFRFGRPRNRYFDVDFGMGKYVATSYLDECDGIRCSRTIDESSDFGLYVGVSGRIFEKLALGLRVHDASFDIPANVNARTRKLSGPIYLFQIGWEFGNW